MITSKHNYLNTEIVSLKNIKIYEADLSSAGLSVIKHKKLLSDELITELINTDKVKRNIRIGLIMRDRPDIIDEINSELINIRREFTERNKIEDADILSVKRDALFVMAHPKVLRLNDDYVFKIKNVFTSYLYLDKKEFYYNEDELIVKNISDYGKKVHADFWIELISGLMRMNETISDKNIFYDKLQRLREDYLTRSLAVGFYREFNVDSKYKILGFDYLFHDDLSEDLKELIDINYNFHNVIIKLFGIFI